MNIKELLLEGCMISMPYKVKKNDWVGDIKISIFSGYYSKPKVYISGIKEPIEWPLEQIDDAIKEFENIVYNPKNLMYKMSEVIGELNERGDFGDLDDHEYLNKVRNIIKTKIK